MPTLDALLQLGGPFAILGALIVAAKYAIDALNAYRSGRPTRVPAVSDAATANALLLDALRVERAHSAEKDKRIEVLESKVAKQQTQLYALRDEYEHELGDLRKQLESVTMRLEAMVNKLPEIPDTTQ